MSLNLLTSVPTLPYKWWDLVWGLLKFNFDNKRLMVAFVFGDSVIPRAKLFLYRRNIDLCFPGGFPPTLMLSAVYKLRVPTPQLLDYKILNVLPTPTHTQPGSWQILLSFLPCDGSFPGPAVAVVYCPLMSRLLACASDQAQRAIKITTALKVFEAFF